MARFFYYPARQSVRRHRCLNPFDTKKRFTYTFHKRDSFLHHGWLAIMGKREIIDIIRRSMPEMESRYGVKRVGLFGSYVTGRQRKRSDIDILVAFSRDIDLFEFLDLRECLEDRLQTKVDLVMESALKPGIGKRILAQVEYA